MYNELCEKLKFDNSTKWYWYNAESDQKNETQYILDDSKI